MKTPFYRVALRFLLLVSLTATGLSAISCKKDTPEVKDYSAIDDAIIKKYLADNNITDAVKQPNGLYFRSISKSATGAKITTGSTVSVLYTGRLLDAAGTVFDASSKRNNVPLNFIVGSNQLIQGFESGVGLMNYGDKAELFIPSALAYGSSSNGAIPANSVVRFEIEVIDYKVVDDA